MGLRTIQFLFLTLGLTVLPIKSNASAPFSVGGTGQSISGVTAPVGMHGLGGTCPVGQIPLIDQVPNGVGATGADSSCGFCSEGAQTIADDFIITADASVTQIVIWGIYFDSDTLPDPLNPFTVILHKDLQGLPGPVISSQLLLPTSVTETGVIIFDFTEFMFVFDLDPVELTAGTYWVEMFADTAGNPDGFAWELGDLDKVRGRESGAFERATPGNNWTAIDPPMDYSLIVCAIADEELFSDGFESGDSSAWSLTFPSP